MHQAHPDNLAEPQTESAINKSGFSAQINEITRLLTELLKAVALLGVIVWFSLHQDILHDWLRGVTHAEAFGVKLDRKTIDDATAALQEIVQSQKQSGSSFALGEGAIRRAARVAPAIVGSNVLWVDDKPEGNEHERGVLEKIKINVTLARSTDDALRALRRKPFDLGSGLITNSTG